MALYRSVPPSSFNRHGDAPNRAASLPSVHQYYRPSHAQKVSSTKGSNSATSCHPSTSIPRLREAINSLDSKMALLMNQRHELEAHLEQAVRLQSPIHRLPNEILASIFVIGVMDVRNENPVMVPTLMLVCRYWEEVVLDTPVLWSKISVSPHDSLEKARRKLSRSKSCPLDISISFGPRLEHLNTVTEQIVHAMDIFRPALWRTRSFTLSVPTRPQAHAALSRCQEEAPMLESLDIQIHRSDDHHSSPPLPLFRGHTPRLRSCSLTSFNFDWDTRLVSRLRVLKLGGYFNGFVPSPNTLLGILRLCPDLEEFALRNMSNVESDSCYPFSFQEIDLPTTSKIRLPRLSRISFYCSGNVFTRQIMNQIAFPNLESLEMCYLENVTPILQLLYTQALTRLPLQHLRIESCLFNEQNLATLLRKLPSMTRLELVDLEDASSNLLSTLSSSQPWVCPKLDTVTLDGCTSLDWDSLRTFVESRLPANSYPRYQDARAFRSAQVASTVVSASASAAAAGYSRSGRSRSQHPQAVLPGPRRIRSIDVTRCSQISTEMVQWLRMYIPEVKCEPAKGVWG
ncbi:hypothetical protein F5878DRAFT_344373 [Lentinula raphanica]|uniref:F-box domain-containing protein n=1 Tax=Lentinula raphanica TaxID=153919 RepID=A0AA38UIS5_9AGAR|nr:hypothetical protein C8R42DRAFT_184437 [Lentinula raphanica]KAJ3822860.1 hypothetical protein F5880DRAFT_616404 [Lentinula raphanica]KAJ3842909.1 hypothetical protein F5878DRAFT_344373 [Lentinula raphanica]